VRGVRIDARTALVVGHNPGLEALVQQLTGEAHDLPTAALVHVAMAIDEWSEVTTATTASIVDTWRPRGC
jgi:phosphohistidine phosphatase